MLLLIFGREILSRKPGSTFIGEVKCSQIMYDKLKELGGRPIMYKTGHSLIKAKMKEEHAELAGEMSGHMFFADRYYGYDDAIYAACRLLEIVSNRVSRFPPARRNPKAGLDPELRVDCPDDQKFRLVEKVAEIYRRQRQIVDIDGVRVQFEGGWGLVRASNTQPILVMRFEASSEDLLDKYKDEVEQIVEQAKTEIRHLEPVERDYLICRYAQFRGPKCSVRPANGLMAGPPQTPTPVFKRAFSRLNSTA